MNDHREFEHYANAMFAHDTIHEAWVADCAKYLVSVFGAQRLRGATVLDYAFGRGNWSLAFLRAGASRVVAIDAAESNVCRFSAYCQTNAIRGIEVELGNVLETELAEKFDVIWLYGILHHVAERHLFLNRIANCLADATSEALVYCYNSHCLRQRIVSAARTGVVYGGSGAFERDALLFNPHARLRARDDLTAPWIDWYSRDDLVSLLSRASLVPLRSTPGFSAFLGLPEAPEFSPHHVVCRRGAEAGSFATMEAADADGDTDHRVIGDLADWIVSRSADESRNFAIGLFNTHFPALRHRDYETCIAEDFQYLLFCWRKLGLDVPDDPTMSLYLQGGLAATAGRPVSFPDEVLRRSGLAIYLRDHTLRL